MPSTVNGIGTWYYGKDNLVTRKDRCQFCGNFVELKSYDTTLYFVVLFIPIIPLGRKRILDECPSCRRHRAAKLSEWEKKKGEVILRATEAWQADRADKQKAIDAIGSTIAFHDVESFRHLAGVVGEAFKRDADAQIFLGGAYDHFGDTAEAEAAYRAAIAIRPDEASKEAMARFLIRQIKPTEAEPLLAHVLPNKQRANAGLLLALAETYQATGDHESAFRLVDDVGTAFPDILSDPGFERIRRSVSKYRGTNKAVRSAGMETRRREGAQQTSWFTRHRGAAIIGLIALIFGVWYFGAAITGARHTVSLVNGTPTPYTVDINGQRYSVPAMGRTPVDLSEGVLKVNVPDKAAAIAPTSVELRTNFWRRAFEHRNFIINPDRVAAVLWEETEYGQSSGKHEQRPHELHVGGVLYNLDKVDYLFTSFPQSIKAEENSGTIKKTRIDVIHDLPPVLMAQMIKGDLGAAAAGEWARRYAVLCDDDVTTITALATTLPRAQEIEFLRAHLTDRPVRIEWHRRYQGIVQIEQPGYDLVGEYRGLVAKDQGNSVLTYLLARLIDDRDEATKLFRQAAEGPQPCGHALYALAHDALIEGDFAKSLQLVRAARKLSPDTYVFRLAEIDALEALNRPAEAVPLLAELQKHQGTDADLVKEEVRLLVKKGDVPAARTRIDGFCQELGQMGFTEQAVVETRNSVEATMYYASGDLAACRKALAGSKLPRHRFELALLEGKLDEAQKTPAETNEEEAPWSATDYLVLYIAAKSTAKADSADAAWAKAIETMKTKGARHDRLFVQELASGAPPSPKALRDWVAAPEERAVMMTALGLRYPQKQTEYFPVARKLNFTNRFPSRLLAQVTQ